MTWNYALKDLPLIAKSIWQKMQQGNYRVLALYGEMGSGKTTLVRALVEATGSKDSVSSPTFALIHEYLTQDEKSIYHLDLYRLKSWEEAVAAGVEEVLYGEGFCLIEWPEIAADWLPSLTLHAKISLGPDHMRQIRLVNE